MQLLNHIEDVTDDANLERIDATHFRVERRSERRHTMNTEKTTPPAVVLSSVELDGLVPKSAKLSARQKRMQKAIAYMREYMSEYHKQACCLDYTDAILIDDVLYGLGIALHGKACSYEAWIEKLREHLKPPNAGNDPRSFVD